MLWMRTGIRLTSARRWLDLRSLDFKAFADIQGGQARISSPHRTAMRTVYWGSDPGDASSNEYQWEI